ncbi:glycosyltransferase family 2 protein [Pseudomonadota bacterium]
MLSLLIATRNGADTLPQALNSLCAQTLNARYWELIIINNGSTDSTTSILEHYTNKLPLTVLHEAKPGKNIALNQAIPLAKGDLIIFSDDDVIFHPDWLLLHMKAAADNPDFDIFGGPILPLWPHPPQQWILDNVPLGTTYAIHEQIPHEGECSIGIVWGANFSVRRAVFDTYGLLHENIGPQGTNYAMGSESAYLYKLHKLKHLAYFIPLATVRHIIHPLQMEKSWTLNRAKRFGKGAIKLEILNGSANCTTIIGLPRWAAFQLLSESISLLVNFLNVNKRYKTLWKINYYLGYISEFVKTKSGDEAEADKQI